MIRRTVLFMFVVSLVAAGCRSTGKHSDGKAAAPFFKGMGSHQRKITTTSPTAQRYFNQGLVWTFAFNHDEAIRSYSEATQLDPQCAMCWWGIALASGPHINNATMDDAHSKAACDAVQQALSLVDKATPVEQELILALSKRYAYPTPKDRKPYDQAYADAMRAIWKKHPQDTDVGVLFAESLMNLWPWNYWTHEGRPNADTNEIVATIEEVLRQDPNHPGACHLYIHAVESSPHAAKAVPAADRLRNLVPASGHLVHMPSHIDVRVGKWSLAADTNAKAVEVDRKYRAISPRQGFYRVYMAHNHHFLSYAAMMEGRSEVSVQAARAMVAGIPKDWAMQNAATIDGYTLITTEALMRFGKWDEILREPAPPEYFPIATAFHYFARGIAYAAKGQLDDAEKEKAKFLAARANVPTGATMAINPASKTMNIAEHMLNGEIAFRRGQVDESVAELRKAIVIEDSLMYMEPPDWIQPVRHTLGAFLLSAGRFGEAEQVYNEDLKYWPENGWSLYGLSRALQSQGKTAEADAVEKRFRAAWSRADTQIGASCLCVPGSKRAG